MFKNPAIAFFKLIRIENLLIIVATQYCIKYFVFSITNDFSQLTPLLFNLMVLSTVLIAAAGYIINDYFDVKTDKINRPETVVIDVYIKRRWAMVLHIVFNALGLAIGVYLALKCHHLRLVLFQLVSIVLLWFYSTHFKKQVLVGNLVVAALTATIPVMPAMYEYYLFGELNFITSFLFGSLIDGITKIVIVYAAFAFLTSLAREIIKDMEDFKGDIETGCKTMPVVWGIITSKVVTFFVLLNTIALLLLSCLKFYNQHHLTAVYYILGLLVLPTALLILLTIKAKTSKQFKAASLLLKFIMLLGIAFTFIIKTMYE